MCIVETGGEAVRLKLKHEINLCFMYDSSTSLKVIYSINFGHESFMVGKFSLVLSCYCSRVVLSFGAIRITDFRIRDVQPELHVA